MSSCFRVGGEPYDCAGLALSFPGVRVLLFSRSGNNFAPPPPWAATFLRWLDRQIKYAFEPKDTSGLPVTSGASFNGSLGWRFVVKEPNVSVVQLGISTKTKGKYSLSLWCDSDKKLLKNIAVKTTRADQWTFKTADPPISLDRGTSYSVVAWRQGGAQYRYVNAGEWKTDGGVLESKQVAYLANAKEMDYPSTLGTVHEIYGVVNVGYTVS